MSNVAVALAKNKDASAADKMFDEALALAENIHGRDGGALIPLLTARAEAPKTFGKRGAKSTYKRAMKIAAGTFGTESPEYAELALQVGSSLINRFGAREGRSYVAAALEYFRTQGEAGRKATGLSLYYLGKIDFVQGKAKRSAELLTDALTKLSTEDPESRAYSLLIHALLVRIYEQQNKSELATEHCVAIGRDSQFRPDQDYLPLFRVPPRYPSALLKSRIQGYVDFEFTVDENGIVRNAEVTSEVQDGKQVRGTPNSVAGNLGLLPRERSFAAAARAAVERFRYAPRFVDGVAVATEGVEARIRFELAN